MSWSSPLISLSRFWKVLQCLYVGYLYHEGKTKFPTLEKGATRSQTEANPLKLDVATFKQSEGAVGTLQQHLRKEFQNNGGFVTVKSLLLPPGLRRLLNSDLKTEEYIGMGQVCVFVCVCNCFYRKCLICLCSSAGMFQKGNDRLTCKLPEDLAQEFEDVVREYGLSGYLNCYCFLSLRAGYL